ncbi:hypothetical protein [Hydrogenophaga sp.]|uniref:hypothetical protein n=1 Tax=Hydrogenophaga sp. TaxID=1904254 RepID=UPI003D14FD4F
MKQFVGLVTIWAACSWVSAQAPAPLDIRWSDAEPLTWSGIAAGEPAGGTASFLYPAPNAGGLIAAILTHSLLVNGSRESERQDRQRLADQALNPFRAAIEGLDSSLLTHDLRARWVSDNAGNGNERRLVHLLPHFRISADHRVIVLNVRIRVQEPDAAPDRHVFDQMVQVVSTPHGGEEPLTAWLANDAHHFREEVVSMLGHAIDIALKLGPLPPSSPARTQRYIYGTETRMERGQPLASRCGRVVLWTLRESWMSVPVTHSDPMPCASGYAVAKP